MFELEQQQAAFPIDDKKARRRTLTHLQAVISSFARICRKGHTTIPRMLRFRDHLRQHSADRLRHQELKFKLERENIDGIQEYLAAKEPFIRAILASLD